MSARRSILICTYGSAGDLLPYLAVGHELRRRGWHVTVGAPAVHAARIRGLGLGAAPIRPDKAVNEPDPDLWDRIRSGRASPGALFSEMFLPSLRASFEDTLAAAGGVDVILSHTLAFAAPIVAQRLGVAWISGVVSPIAYFSRSDPPVVGPGWSGPALRAFGGSGARIAAAAKDGVLRAWSGEWRAIRRECGLDDRGDPVSAQHSPLRALALFSPLLAAPQPDWPASALVTGFPFVDDPTAAGMEPDLGAFLDAGEPPLVVTLGTTAVNEAGGFYDAAAAAAGMLGLRAVLLVGSRPGNLPAQLPRGVIATPYAPLSALLPRARAVIHQGGIGTLAQAMRSGQPSLIVPFAHDQPDNAARAVRLGIARTLGRRAFTASTAAAALESLLGDSALTRRARETGDIVRLEDGARVAADAVEAATATRR